MYKLIKYLSFFLILLQSVNLLMTRLFPLQPVPSYGTQTPHNNSHSVNVPMTEMHTHKDCMFEAMGDSASERHAHTVYYNICQVWPVRSERLQSGRVGSDGAWRRDGLCGLWTASSRDQAQFNVSTRTFGQELRLTLAGDRDIFVMKNISVN